MFTCDHDADVMHNSVSINLNMLERCRLSGLKRNFALIAAEWLRRKTVKRWKCGMRSNKRSSSLRRKSVFEQHFV